MAKKALSLYKYILSALMGLLGFSSCIIPRAEYGSPHATLSIKAKIVDESGAPVSNAKIRLRTEDNVDHGTYIHDGYIIPLYNKSDSNGMIDTTGTFYAVPCKGETYFVFYAKDNPHLERVFKDDSVMVNPVQVKKAKDWFWGSYNLEGTLKLKEKPSTDE